VIAVVAVNVPVLTSEIVYVTTSPAEAVGGSTVLLDAVMSVTSIV
jgi:hypothetical protein